MVSKPQKAYRVKISTKDGKMILTRVMNAKDRYDLDTIIWRTMKFTNPFTVAEDYDIQVIELNNGKPMYLNESVGR